MSSPTYRHDLPEKFTLPLGWGQSRLGDLCNLINGDAFRESDWSSEGTPIIRIQNLNDHSKPFNFWKWALDGRVVVEPGAVLLAWSGTPGTSFGTHLWTGPRGVLNQHIFRVDLDHRRIEPRWAVLAVNQQLSVLIRKSHGGVGLRHVTRSEVESLTIPLPPIGEQQRLAAILAERVAIVGRGRVAAEAQLEAAKALPAAQLRAVFDSLQSSFWPRTPLGRVADLLASRSIAGDGDTPVQAITTACLTEMGFSAAGVKAARMWRRDVPECTVSPDEVLVARSNTPELVGRASRFEGEAAGVVASDLTIRIRAKGQLLPGFLSGYLSFLYLSGYWKERSGGASGSMKKITREQIEAELIPVPPKATQQEVDARIKRELIEARQLRVLIESRLATINTLPAALLRRAFGGEL